MKDEASALDWLQGLSSHGVGTLDLPILSRLHRAWCLEDTVMLGYWNAQLLAARETGETRAQERHLGRSLAQVLVQLKIRMTLDWLERSAAFATLFSLAAVRWEIPRADTLSGYLWAWSENQVLAAVKLVPLGQSAGQRLLYQLTDMMPALVAQALSLADEAIGVGVVSQAIASARHETQYSRLFRS